MRFKNSTLVSNLSCNNITDQFALGNNKATLIYPIGLISYEGGTGLETDPWIADEQCGKFNNNLKRIIGRG